MIQTYCQKIKWLEFKSNTKLFFVLIKVDKGKVSVEKGRAHFVPVRHIFHELGLVGQSENMHVGRNVEVKDVECVGFA